MPCTNSAISGRARSLRTATALVASLSMLVPGLSSIASAQELSQATRDAIQADCAVQNDGDDAATAACVGLAEANAAPAAEAAPEIVIPEDVAPEPEPEIEVAPVEEVAPEAEPAEEAAPEAAPVGEAAPEAAPVEQAAPEAAPAEEATPEAAPVEEAAPEAAAPIEEAPVDEAPVEEAAPEAAAPAEDAPVEQAPVEEVAPESEAPVEEAIPEAVAPVEEVAPEAVAPVETAPAEAVPEESVPEEAAPEAVAPEAAPEATSPDVIPAPAEAETGDDDTDGAALPEATEGQTPELLQPQDGSESAVPSDVAPPASATPDAGQATTVETPAGAGTEQEAGDAAPKAALAPIEAAPVEESAFAAEVESLSDSDLTVEETTARDQLDTVLGVVGGPDGTEAAPTSAAAAASDTVAADVEESTVAAGDARTSGEEFSTKALSKDKDDRDRGLSDGAKIAIGALGALAVGTLFANRSRVVSNSGDRVVVQREDGGLQVLKDDNALLRQAGSDLRTERFDDGSSRQTVLRQDGSQIVTIRDASLRVLRREVVQQNGERYTLIDDTTEFQPVDVSNLPRPAPVVSTRSATGDPLGAALAQQNGLDRRFSLSQIRTIPQVRALAPAYEVNNVTFASGSAAILPEQAPNLSGLAREVLASIEANPRQVFLVEGHTDATGDAALNLALSDRRAESLALALNEYFGVPVENLVVQGYGEQYLKVQTQVAEQANRRATVRDITGLLQTAAAN